MSPRQTERLRILFVSSLYSTPLQPARGMPNARIVARLKRSADVKVVAPVPYYPRALLSRRPDLRALVDLPEVERDFDGTEVLHPRYAHIPGFGRSLYGSLYGLSTFPTVLREALRFKPDVILSAWAYPDGVAAVAMAKALGLPSVLRVMGSDINAYGQHFARRQQIAFALRGATKVIAVSNALRQACEDIVGPSENIEVIPTGVDGDHFAPLPMAEARAALRLPHDRSVILVPARLSLEKGVHHFLSAFAALESDDLAVIAGDGGERARLVEQAHSLKISDRVIFAGQISEARMPLYYSAADLACLPSTEEGWPNVLLESFACGCPWVASDVGGVGEILKLTDGGLLARPGDPRHLAEQLAKAKTMSWDRAALRRLSTSRCSLNRTAQLYLETCERAAGRIGVVSASPSPTPTVPPPPSVPPPRCTSDEPPAPVRASVPPPKRASLRPSAMPPSMRPSVPAPALH